MTIKVSRQALNDIRVADAWWRANRPAARDLLRVELRRALRVLEEQPHLGAAAREKRLQGVRRLYLRGSRYFLYYSVNQTDVEVLRLWHASRGGGPKL